MSVSIGSESSVVKYDPAGSNIVTVSDSGACARVLVVFLAAMGRDIHTKVCLCACARI